MSTRIPFLAMAMALFLSAGCATTRTQPADDPATAEAIARYEQLREQLRGGDDAVSMQMLREAYMRTPHYQPYQGPVNAGLRAIVNHLNRGDFEACLTTVRELQDEAFPLLSLHHYGAYCAHQLDKAADEEMHMGFARQIFHAIIEPGDGRSMETAWRTLTTPELYLVLAIHELRPRSQALVSGEGRMFDVMTVVPEGQEREETRYFDITPQMAFGMRDLDGEGR